MNILTVENETLLLSHIPEEIEKYNDIQYCVLDYTNKDNVDYQFYPMVYLETFNFPGANLRIGNNFIKLPIDWSIVIGDKFTGDLEMIELKQLNDRAFDVFAISPISGFMPEFLPIQMIDIFPDVEWCFPKLRHGHILAIPLTQGSEPLCIFCCKDKNKIPDSLDIRQMV